MLPPGPGSGSHSSVLSELTVGPTPGPGEATGPLGADAADGRVAGQGSGCLALQALPFLGSLPPLPTLCHASTENRRSKAYIQC